MGWVKPLLGIFAVGAVASVALGGGDEDTVVVNRVIDGDTIDVDIDGENTRVRLLNIDTPEIGHNGEPSECLAEEAKQYLEGRLPKEKEVRLEYDSERTDKYGRTLAGVFIDDDFINADVAAEGLATAVVFGGNDKFYDELHNAERGPKEAGEGIFGVSDECKVSSDEDMAEALSGAEAAAAAFAAFGEADIAGYEDVLDKSAAAKAGLAVLTRHKDDRSTFQKAAYPDAPKEIAAKKERELEGKEKQTREELEKLEEKEREEERREKERQEEERRRAEQRQEEIRQQEHDAPEVEVAEQPTHDEVADYKAPEQQPAPQPAPVVDNYTGCRAYGGNYAMTSVDKNGRSYAKIDCTTKQQIG